MSTENDELPASNFSDQSNDDLLETLHLDKQLTSIVLEERNYKIDDGLSIGEKCENGWQKEPSGLYLLKAIPGPKDYALVYEYVGNYWPDLIGEQRFTGGAIANLGLEGTLLSKKEFQLLIQDKSENSPLSKYPVVFAGFRIPDSGTTRKGSFRELGHQASLRLKDDNNVIVKANGEVIYGSKNLRYAYSVRRKKR